MSLVVRREDPASADAQVLIEDLSATLTTLTGASGKAGFDIDDVRGTRACFAIARDAGGRAVGCGAFRPLDAEVAEIKRMFARPGTGSGGIGTAVLRFLEAEAARLGYLAVRLETRRVNERAVAFYQRHGYRPIANYGRYAGNTAAACFEKRLGP